MELSKLTNIEREMVQLFVSVADVLALPRSVGELYGLLFVSEVPLCMDDCMKRLQISKGSVSQGLKALRAFGAVKTVYIPGSRKDYFVAETELRKMAGGFVKEQVRPHLESGSVRITEIQESLSAEYSADSVVSERIGRLAGWHRKLERTLPLMLKLIGE